MKPFSVATISALTEVITGGSGMGSGTPIGHYRSGPKLEQFLGGLNIELRIGNASRVPTVRAALTTKNNDLDGRDTIIRVLEAAAEPSDYIDDTEKLNAVVAYMNKRLAFDDCELRMIGKRYRVVSVGTNSLAASALKEKADTLKFESVQEDFDRALNEADSNPAGAVTAACATVESVCKSLLDELGIEYPSKQDVQHLSNAVATELGLSPARTDLPTLLAQDLKQILGGLQTIAGGVGALRTHFGDAHGKGRTKAPIDARIARLAIHAASTLSLFYIETWQRLEKGKTGK